MYVDASADCNDLVFYLGKSGYSYNIRITQYNCEYENLAPKGCTEYLFGEQSGYIYTYNWDDGKYIEVHLLASDFFNLVKITPVFS